MYKLFVDIRAEKYDNVDMRFLSMGMSGDYAAAIEEGSNMVRVGSAIFGSRTYYIINWTYHFFRRKMISKFKK
jgi:uncharacterized pyridoxal phosphate-containing UPF0001 family protein